MEFIAMCLGILAGLIGIAVAVNTLDSNNKIKMDLLQQISDLIDENNKLKIKEPPTLSEAVEAIRQYCNNQEDGGRCAFNRNESNAVCDCRLLKNIPEDWSNADNKE